MSDQLSMSEQDLAAAVANFTSGINPTEEAQTAQIEQDLAEGTVDMEGDIEVKSNWADEDSDEESLIPNNPKASKPNIPETPPQTIKFKANGEDKEISLEEAQKKLSLAEGARQALQDRAKLRKELDTLKKQSQELAKYKETWDKLESVKHDRRQLVELITGESYDDFLKDETQRREIHQYGTPEQKQLLEYADRVQKLERERQLEISRNEAKLKQAEQAQWEAEQQRVQNAMNAEFSKHELPDDIDSSAKARLRDMLWNQSKLDVIKYYQQYGKVTQKMVEKAFADNAAVILRSNAKLAEKQVSEAKAAQKSEAKEKAKLAAVSPAEPQDWDSLSKLSPDRLFDYFKTKKRK